MILLFLYISYSFVVSRPVSGTLRDFQTPFSSKGKFVGTAQTNSQGRKCSIYKLSTCSWMCLGRDDRQLLQLRQISVDTREAAELLRRTSWERNFVWKRSLRMMLHLFMGTIGLVLFVWQTTHLRLVEVGPGLVQPSSGIWDHLLQDTEPPDPCLDLKSSTLDHVFVCVGVWYVPGYAPSISCSPLLSSLWTWSGPSPASAP